MRISDAVTRLCRELSAKGRSKETILSYQRHLTHLVEYLNDCEVASINSDQLLDYASFLRKRDVCPVRAKGRRPGHRRLSVHSVNSYLRSARRLFTYLAAKGWVDKDLWRDVAVDNTARPEPKAASIDDIHRLIATCSSQSLDGIRDRAIICFLYSTGCRIGGLASLCLGTLDIDRGTAIVEEKGHKRRAVYLDEGAKASLRHWLAVRPQADDDWVFTTLGPSARNTQLTACGIGQMFKRRRKAAKIGGRCNPHSLRHAFAVDFLSNGGPAAQLMQLMGHSDIKTTMASYGHLPALVLQAARNRYGPNSATLLPADSTE